MKTHHDFSPHQDRRAVSRRPLRVVLDARALSHPQAGGWHTYLRTLVKGLAEVRPADVEVLLYLDRPLRPETGSLVPAWMAQRVLRPARVQTDWGLFAAQVAADAPDLVHGTMNYLPQGLPRRVVRTVTIHDAIGIKNYPFTRRVQRSVRGQAISEYMKWVTRLSARQAERIITVSRSAKQDISDALGARCAARVTVVYNGIALPPPRPAALYPGQREARSVLAIASSDPRKNVDALFRAFAHHADLLSSACGGEMPRLDVVCGGVPVAERVRTALAAYGITHYSLLRDLDDAALSDQMARATVFAFPSRREGFGYPPLEAMQAGCAVVSSQAPCMPEVLGDVPLYFDPDRADQLAACIGSLLADPAGRAERGRRGRVHAAQYTCRRTAEATLAVWREATAAAPEGTAR